MRTMKLLGINTLLALLLLSLLIGIGCPLAFFYSEWMPRSLLITAERAGLLRYEGMRGTFADGLTLEKLEIGELHSDQFAALVEPLSITLSSDWRFSALWDGSIQWRSLSGLETFLTIKVDQLTMDNVVINLPPTDTATKQPAAESPFHQLKQLQLPHVQLPIAFELSQLEIATLKIFADRLEALTHIKLAQLAVGGANWSLGQFAMTSRLGSAQLTANGQMKGDWPLSATLHLKEPISDSTSAMHQPHSLLSLSLFDTAATLSIEGNLAHYRTHLNLSSRTMQNRQLLEDLQIDISAAGGRDALIVKSASLAGPLGKADLAGSLVWEAKHRQPLRLQGYLRTSLKQLDLAPIAEQHLASLLHWPEEEPQSLLSPVNAEAKWAFEYQAQPTVKPPSNTDEPVSATPYWQLQGELVDLQTELMGAPVALKTALTWRSSAKVPTVSQLDFSWGGQQKMVAFHGKIEEQWALGGSVQLNTYQGNQGLERQLQRMGLKAVIAADFAMSGPLQQPMIDWQSSVNRLVWQDQSLWNRVKLNVVGTLDALQVSLGVADGLVDSRLTLTAGVDKLLQKQPLQGRLLNWRIIDPLQSNAATAWVLREPVVWQWQPQAMRLQVEPFCFDNGTTTLCGSEGGYTQQQGAVTLELEQWRLSTLQNYLPKHLQLQGQVSSLVTLAWQQASPGSMQVTANAKVRADAVGLQYRDPATQVSQLLNLTAVEVTAQYDTADQLAIQAHCKVDQSGRLSSAITLNPKQHLIETGELQVENLDLRLAQPWLAKGQSIGGWLDLSASVAGPLKKPSINSKVRVRDLAVALEKPEISVEKFNLSGSIQESQLNIAGEGRFNEGPLQLTLQTDWRNKKALGLELALKGKENYYSLGKMGELWLSPDIQLSYHNKNAKLTGSVVVPKAVVQLKSSGPKRVALSQDVVIVDQKTKQQQLAEQWVNQFLVDLNINLGKSVKFSGLGAKGRLEGELLVTRDERDMLAGSGLINVKKGEYKAYGQELTITKGQLLFSGPLMLPRLDVEAVRYAKNYNVTAGLRLQGLARSPIATLFAEPTDPFGDLSQQPSSEREILSYLVLGRPAIGSNSTEAVDEKQALTQAALSLGLEKSGIAKKASKALGVKNLEMATDGSGEDAQLIVGGDISERLHLQYAVGLFAPANSIILRYQINQRLYLEALSGLERALDLFYSVEF